MLLATDGITNAQAPCTGSNLQRWSAPASARHPLPAPALAQPAPTSSQQHYVTSPCQHGSTHHAASPCHNPPGPSWRPPGVPSRPSPPVQTPPRARALLVGQSHTSRDMRVWREFQQDTPHKHKYAIMQRSTVPRQRQCAWLRPCPVASSSLLGLR